MFLYLIWVGDMLLKKTEVDVGSTFFSTHFAHVLKTLSYAICRWISSYSMVTSSNDPRLFYQPTYEELGLLFMYKRETELQLYMKI